MWIKYLHELFAFGSLASAKTDAANSYFVCYLVSIVIKAADFRTDKEGFCILSLLRTVIWKRSYGRVFHLVFWLVLCAVVIIRSLPCDVITRSPSCFVQNLHVGILWQICALASFLLLWLIYVCLKRAITSVPVKTSQRNQFEHVQCNGLEFHVPVYYYGLKPSGISESVDSIVLSGEDCFLRFFADSYPSCRQISVNLSLLRKEWQRV